MCCCCKPIALREYNSKHAVKTRVTGIVPLERVPLQWKFPVYLFFTESNCSVIFISVHLSDNKIDGGGVGTVGSFAIGEGGVEAGR